MTPSEVMSKLMSDPELAAAMNKPNVQKAIFEARDNQMAVFKYQDDPDVMMVRFSTHAHVSLLSGHIPCPAMCYAISATAFSAAHLPPSALRASDEMMWCGCCSPNDEWHHMRRYSSGWQHCSPSRLNKLEGQLHGPPPSRQNFRPRLEHACAQRVCV